MDSDPLLSAIDLNILCGIYDCIVILPPSRYFLSSAIIFSACRLNIPRCCLWLISLRPFMIWWSRCGSPWGFSWGCLAIYGVFCLIPSLSSSCSILCWNWRRLLLSGNHLLRIITTLPLHLRLDRCSMFSTISWTNIKQIECTHRSAIHSWRWLDCFGMIGRGLCRRLCENNKEALLLRLYSGCPR